MSSYLSFISLFPKICREVVVLHIVTFSAKNMVSRKKHLTPMLMLKMMIPSKTLKLCRPSCKFIDTCHMCSWWRRFKASLLQWTSQFWAWNMATQHTMLQKLSKCEVKDWLCWNLSVIFYVKSSCWNVGIRQNLISRKWACGKMIKFQQCQSLTSHFDSFWSIVSREWNR